MKIDMSIINWLLVPLEQDIIQNKIFVNLGLPLPDFTIDGCLLDPGDIRNQETAKIHGGPGKFFVDIAGRKRKATGTCACPVPNEAGCYAWHNDSDLFEVARVGKALNLRLRLMDYWSGKDKTLLKWFDDITDREFDCPCVSVWLRKDRESFEKHLIGFFNPPFNKHKK